MNQVRHHPASLLLAIVQALLAIRVCFRLARTANGSTIRRVEVAPDRTGDVTILIPVLNEAQRLGPCLEGALAHGAEVREILVIDGGSTDGTCNLIHRFAELDNRLGLIRAEPAPPDVNGKAWQLQAGYGAASRQSPWILTLDADVRPDPLLVRSLLAHARSTGMNALSVATRQQLSGTAEGLIHPAMLATLVYRFGIPGHAIRDVDQVQANGQCFLVKRELLDSVGSFAGVAHSVCEDVTLARTLAAAGYPVGFYESDNLISVEMYSGWREAWNGWTRSLPMRDRFSNRTISPGMIDVLFTQTLPPWIVLMSLLKRGRNHPLARLNLVLLCIRFGVLAGMARAYDQRPWTYWLSPLCDLPVALRIMDMSRRTRHSWRGRLFAPGELR